MMAVRETELGAKCPVKALSAEVTPLALLNAKEAEEAVRSRSPLRINKMWSFPWLYCRVCNTLQDFLHPALSPTCQTIHLKTPKSSTQSTPKSSMSSSYRKQRLCQALASPIARIARMDFFFVARIEGLGEGSMYPMIVYLGVWLQ